MTDRELIEAAAKAAGEKVPPRFYPDGSAVLLSGKRWNPLDDDGDALRLAVALRLVVDVGTQAAHAFHEGPGEVEAHGADPAAATRRAIVRAAALAGTAPGGA